MTDLAGLVARVEDAGGWRGRRLLAVPLLAALGLGALAAGAGWPRGHDPAWSVLAALTPVLAGLVLSTFVPRRGSGRLLEPGCGSCSVVAAGAPVLAVWWLATSPADPWSAVLAAGVTAAALAKRLTDPVACPR